MYIYQKTLSRGLTRISFGYTLESMLRRKPKGDRKEKAILVRTTVEQKATLAAAAKRAGLDLSSWLRSLGLREAALEGSDQSVKK